MSMCTCEIMCICILRVQPSMTMLPLTVALAWRGAYAAHAMLTTLYRSSYRW